MISGKLSTYKWQGTHNYVQVSLWKTAQQQQNHIHMYANAAELRCKYVKLREQMHCLHDKIDWYEVMRDVPYLKNNKAPGLNGVPPNASKCMDERNLKTVYIFICKFWKGNRDYEEWHEGQVVLVPKMETQATQTNGEAWIWWMCALKYWAEYWSQESPALPRGRPSVLRSLGSVFDSPRGRRNIFSLRQLRLALRCSGNVSDSMVLIMGNIEFLGPIGGWGVHWYGGSFWDARLFSRDRPSQPSRERRGDEELNPGPRTRAASCSARPLAILR